MLGVKDGVDGCPNENTGVVDAFAVSAGPLAVPCSVFSLAAASEPGLTELKKFPEPGRRSGVTSVFGTFDGGSGLPNKEVALLSGGVSVLVMFEPLNSVDELGGALATPPKPLKREVVAGTLACWGCSSFAVPVQNGFSTSFVGVPVAELDSGTLGSAEVVAENAGALAKKFGIPETFAGSETTG
jgi:hypothetical protein